MSDDEGRVIPFRPTGGAAPPPPPPPPPPLLGPPPPPVPPVPAEPPEPAVDDTIAAPAEPGEGAALPELSVPDPAVPPAPVPALPGSPDAAATAMLRSEGLDAGDTGENGGREGAGSAMVVAIGIAVACLRGMSQWLADRRQRFQDLAPVREAAAKARAEKVKARAEHEAALVKIGHDAAQARAKGRIQSPTEFGRSAKGGGGRSGTGGKPGGTFGPKADAKTRPAASDGLATRKTPRKTPDAQKAAAARREATKDAARPEHKKQGPLERMRRRTDGSGGKDGASGKGGKKPSSTNGATTSKGDRKPGRPRGKADAARPDSAKGGKAPAGDAAKKPGGTPAGTKGKGPGGKRGKTGPKSTETGGKAGSAKKPSGPKKPGPGKTPGAGKGGKAGRPEKVDLTKKPKAPKGSSTAPPKATSPKPTPPKDGGRKKTTKPHSGRKKPKAGPASAPGGTGPGTGGPKTTGTGTAGSRPGSRSRRTRGQTPPPRTEPRDNSEGLRPPPGMDRTHTITIERIDRKPPEARTPAAIAPARPGLPAGTASEPPAPPAPGPRNTPSSRTTGPAGTVPSPRKEARPMSGAPAVQNIQFTDSDLTVYDVIESDEDMSEQILLGAVHARHVAERCQRLQAALEEMRQELIAKSVPGVFVGWCTRLIERAGVVETKADAVADGLPRASEAIAHAGQLAAEHDKPVADVVRDMGHTAPADASYHKE